MGFPVPQVSRRRTNELGNLMRVLVLCAIHFDDRARIPKQDLCGSLDQACLPRPGRAEKKKDRKSTRLNSSHRCISYAVFCLKKKKTATARRTRWSTQWRRTARDGSN